MWILEFRYLIVGMALSCFTGVAPAQERSVPVHVDFEVRVPAMELAWSAREQEVVDAVRSALVKQLGEQFPHWRFDGGISSPIVLEFGVSEPLSNEVQLDLRLEREGRVLSKWEESWLKPADAVLHGFPPAEEAPGEITDAFLERLIESRRVTIDESLRRHVPIAVGAQWVRPAEEPRLVVPLRWDAFAELSESLFRVACKSREGVAELRSEGKGMKAPFTPDAEPPFDAILIVPHCLERADDCTPLGDDVHQLEPRLVYLEEYKPRSLWSLAPAGEVP